MQYCIPCTDNLFPAVLLLYIKYELYLAHSHQRFHLAGRGGDNSPGQLPVLLSYDGGMGYTPLLLTYQTWILKLISVAAWNGSTWLIGGYGTSCLYSYDGDSTYTDLSSYLPDNNLTIIGMAWNGSEWLLGGIVETTQTNSFFVTDRGKNIHRSHF